jgi:pyruvate formate lyase activating enzyme
MTEIDATSQIPLEAKSPFELGRYKWHQLGLPYTLEEVKPPALELVERACAVFRKAGLRAH